MEESEETMERTMEDWTGDLLQRIRITNGEPVRVRACKHRERENKEKDAKEFWANENIWSN